MHKGIQIKTARITMGLRQKDLARMLGRSVQLIAHIEQTGKIRPELWSTLSAILPLRDVQETTQPGSANEKLFVLEENQRIMKECMLSMSKHIERLEASIEKKIIK